MQRRALLTALSLSTVGISGCNKIISSDLSNNNAENPSPPNGTSPDGELRDWPMVHRTPAGTAFVPPSSAPSTFPLEQKWRSEPRSWGTRFPIVLDDLFLITTKWGVIALDSSTGETIWKFKGGQFNRIKTINNAPAIAGETVYAKFGYTTFNPGIASSLVKGRLFALDASTGNPIWSFQTKGRASDTSPIVVDDVVYIGDGSGQVHGIDASNGNQVWMNDSASQGKGKRTVRISDSPTYVDGTVYFGTREMSTDQWDDGHVYAIDASDGTELWRTQTGAPVTSAPAVTTGAVYIVINANTQAYIAAIDASNGQQKWRTEFANPIETNVAVANETLFFATDNHLHAVEKSTGSRVWQFAFPGQGLLTHVSDPLVTDTSVFFTVNETLYVLDSETGDTLWMDELEEARRLIDIAIADTVIYIGTTSGRVYALE